jgi:SnoaL-like domain
MAKSIEERLQALEDRQAIYQAVCGYGYAVDGLNAEAVGSFYVDDGVYAVGDIGKMEGREAIEAITRDPGHLAYVGAGCAHISTLPYVVIDCDRAVATCHTMVNMHGENGFFIGRLSASRIELARQGDGVWKNYMLDGNPAGSQLLGKLNEGPYQS